MEHTPGPKSCECHFGDNIDTAEYDANFIMCKLHAAAPALLEALEALEGAFKDNPNKPHGSKDWLYTINTDVFSAAIPQARDAIDLAKGN
jgi:hypothetical protein